MVQIALPDRVVVSAMVYLPDLRYSGGFEIGMESPANIDQTVLITTGDP